MKGEEMTKAQALRQAKKWWGNSAFAEKVRREGKLEYQIGLVVMVLLPMKAVKGTGDSWQEAVDGVSEKERRTRF